MFSSRTATSKKSLLDIEGILKQPQPRLPASYVTASPESTSKRGPLSEARQSISSNLSNDKSDSKGIKDWIMECFKLQNILNNQFQMRIASGASSLHMIQQQQ